MSYEQLAASVDELATVNRTLSDQVTATQLISDAAKDKAVEQAGIATASSNSANSSKQSAAQSAADALASKNSAATSATTATAKAGEAATSAASALASKTAAGVSETNAAASAAAAAPAVVAALRFCGVSGTAPTRRLDGTLLQPADEYHNSNDKLRYSWTGTAWVALNSSAQALEVRLVAPTGATLSGYEQRNVNARLSEQISITDLGALAGGNADARPAITAAKLKGVPIVVPAGNFKILADTTFTGPGVEFYPGGSIEVPAGVVLTIDSPLKALPTFIFKGEGVVVFTRKALLKEVYLEWWGGSCDSVVVVDNQPVFIKALRSVGYSSTAVSVIQLLSGDYKHGGIVPLVAGGICIRGVRPVDSYLNAASAGATRISSMGTWTGFLFDAPNTGTVKPGIRFENLIVGVSTTQRQGIWRFGTEVRSPMISNVGAVGAGLNILKSEAPITQFEGGYWNNGYMLEVDIDGNPLTDFVGVVELSGADWIIDRAHIGHDTTTSGTLGFVVALYTKAGAASGRCINTVLEQSDVSLLCAANDCLFTNLRAELSGKEALIVTGNNNQFVNTKIGIQVSARAPGTYDAIKVSGGSNRFIGVNNDITAGSCLNFIHDTRGLTSDSMNTYSDIPQGRPNVAKAYSNIDGLILKADGICSLTPAQGISLYVNLETENVINADNVLTIHGRRPVTPVTRIENGVPGQPVTLMLNQGSTTFKHTDVATGGNGNLWLLTKTDTVVGTMVPITFLKMSDGFWYQTK